MKEQTNRHLSEADSRSLDFEEQYKELREKMYTERKDLEECLKDLPGSYILPAFIGGMAYLAAGVVRDADKVTLIKILLTPLVGLLAFPGVCGTLYIPFVGTKYLYHKYKLKSLDHQWEDWVKEKN